MHFTGVGTRSSDRAVWLHDYHQMETSGDISGPTTGPLAEAAGFLGIERGEAVDFVLESRKYLRPPWVLGCDRPRFHPVRAAATTRWEPGRPKSVGGTRPSPTSYPRI